MTWKNIIKAIAAFLALLASGMGGGAIYEAATAPEPAPAEYASPAGDTDNYWTVTTYFEITRTAGGGATPAHQYKDIIGRATVKVPTQGKPTDAEVIAAYDPELDPAEVRLVNPVYKKPEKWKEPKEEEPSKDNANTE